MKKKIIAVLFVAAFMLTATAVFADFQHPNNTCCFPVHRTCCPEVNVNTSNVTGISNYVMALSNTGMNMIKGETNNVPKKPCYQRYHHDSGSANIETGNALAAAEAANYVNSEVSVGMPTSGKTTVNTTNMTKVDNKVGANANSGLNTITAKSGNIQTGAAVSQAGVLNMVSSKVSVY